MQELLKHFHELSLHPKNTKELKGLILQLAIQGKLTADWRTRHPELVSGFNSAENLYKQIKAEKAKLVQEKKIKKETSLAPIKTTEISYELPEGWQWYRLRDTGFTQTGSTPPKKNPDYYGDYIPFLGPAHISNFKMEYPSEGLSEKGLEKGRLIPKNSLMMVCIGGSIGKCYVNNIDVSCNQQINAVTTLKSPIKYIQFVCQSEYFQRKVFLKSSGSATPIINKGKWESLPIPFPSLEEQKVIVEIVEILFKEVEALENLTEKRIELKTDYATSALNQLVKNDAKEEWQALKPQFYNFFNEVDNIKTLRETILQLAVQGKLTAKWRAQNLDLISGENSAENLLKEIKADKAQLVKEKKIKKEKPVPPITEDEIPYELPEGWVWCRFAEPIINRDGERKPITKGDRNKGKYDYYGASGVIDKVDDFIFEEDLLLIGEDGANLVNRSTPIAFFARGKYWVNNHAHVLDSSEFTVLEYFEKFINSINLEQYLTGMAQPKLPQKRMNLIPIALPPLKEQNVIIQKVNVLMNLCDQLEKEIQASQKQIEGLMQSVLKEV